MALSPKTSHSLFPSSIRAVCRTTRLPDYKVNDLAFANDIALLENDSFQAQRQLEKLEHEAKKVGLEINVQKTEQMRLQKVIQFITF